MLKEKVVATVFLGGTQRGDQMRKDNDPGGKTHFAAKLPGQF